MQELLSKVTAWHLKQGYAKVLHDVLGHIEVVRRLDRAYEMLTRDERYGITRVVENSVLTVSVTSPNDTYTVIPSQQSCTCPDNGNGMFCKHRLAVKVVLEAVRLMHKDGYRVCHC